MDEASPRFKTFPREPQMAPDVELRRIAFCVTDLDPGGAERTLVRIATGLDRATWSPTVFCLSDRGMLVDELESRGVPVACLGARRSGQWRSFVPLVLRLSRALRELRPVILQTFLHHANIVGRLAARRAGVPNVVSGIRTTEPERPWRGRIDRLTAGLVTRHVCVSESVRRFVVERVGLPADRTVVIPNGVDVAAFRDAPPADLAQWGVPKGAPCVLFVGRLERQKGPDVLLEAARRFLSDRGDVHLLFVGAGPLRADLERVAHASPHAARIHFAGWQPDVPGLLRAADLLVVPSRWEGMANVVLEGMAAGIPIVATAVEGVDELLDGGRLGVVVPPGDAEAIAAGVRRTGADPRAARERADLSQQIVHECFAASRCVAAHANLYAELIAAEVPRR